MQVSLSIQGLEKQLERLGSKVVDNLLVESLKDLKGLVENRVGLEARKTVYSYIPKTNKYKRTGRLLGGRGSSLSAGLPLSTQISKYTIKIEANPMLKGADFNYAPAVNDGTGWMIKVGARPFWDNSISWARNQGMQLVQKRLSQKISKL